MRRHLLLASLALSLTAACGTGNGSATVSSDVERAPMDQSVATDDWVAGINGAGWDFHLTLDGNAVSSPASIGTAFSYARAGASADSGATLDAIFGFPAGDTNHIAANNVGLALNAASIDTTTLEVANRLFPDDQFEPLQDFVDIGARYYGAGLQTIDTADGEQAAADINSWVSEQTRELIPVIVQPEIVQDRRMFLVNTVYLKADWADPFLAELTADRDFTTDTGATVTAPFMQFHEPEPRRFVRLDTADAVELPYADGDLAMWLVVPRDVDGLAQLEASTTAAELALLPSRAEPGQIHLAMPKWEQELPPTDLFNWLCGRELCPGASFDLVAPGIFIDSAVHGAKIIVDEKGTEAAAATAIGFDESAPPEPDLRIVADRPFLWTIVHEPTGTLLFVGRVVDPTLG